MSVRDRVETVLRSWNRYEIERGAPPVVDADCRPPAGDEPAAAPSRLAVRHRLVELAEDVRGRDGAEPLIARIGADLAYLDALLGARPPLDDYVRATQGCGTGGWTDEYLYAVRRVAADALAGLGIRWTPFARAELRAVEGEVDPGDAVGVVRQQVHEMEDDVRRFVDTDAPFRLGVEQVDVDEGWDYELDVTGADVDLRINTRTARFTEAQARQFTLHEVLGHGLQCATFAQRSREHDVPGVRLTARHAQHQVQLEGLAHALPLFVRPDDQLLVARVRLTHYLELVRAKLHRAINDGTPVAECAELAHLLVPFWTETSIGDALGDRGADPLQRSYLWAHPAGIDWFVRLADTVPRDRATEILRAAHRAPLTPTGLAELWPEGPAIGGG